MIFQKSPSNSMKAKPEKKPTKLHKKHIVPGFLYSFKDNPKNIRMVTELDNDHRYCKVYLVTEMKFYPCLACRQAIVDGIRKGTLICMTGEEYR